MNTQTEKYKYIDKSTNLLLNEEDTFKVYHFNNLTEETQYFKQPLNNNYIQLFFCLNQDCTVAFNMEHCAINLASSNSSMVYFKDEKMNILFKIPAKNEFVAILISIEYFHSLFSIEGNFLFNFNSFKTGKPIIEPKEISPSVKLIFLLSNLAPNCTSAFSKCMCDVANTPTSLVVALGISNSSP